MRRRMLFRHERQTYAVNRSTDHDFDVVYYQRPVHRDRQGLLALVEFPTVHAGRTVSKVDALVAEQVTRRFRLSTRLEIRRRAHDGRPVIFGDPYSNHVLLDELSEVNAGVEPSSNNIDATVVGGDVEDDVRVIAHKLGQFRCEHCHRGKPWHQQTHATRRFVAEPGDLIRSEERRVGIESTAWRTGSGVDE